MSKKKLRIQKSKFLKSNETKIFWIVMLFLFIGSILLSPETWIGLGKVVWAVVPIIIIGLVYAAFGAKEGKLFDRGLFLLFVGMVVFSLIIGLLIKF